MAAQEKTEEFEERNEKIPPFAGVIIFILASAWIVFSVWPVVRPVIQRFFGGN